MAAKAAYDKMLEEKTAMGAKLGECSDKNAALEREKLELIGSLSTVSKEWEVKVAKLAQVWGVRGVGVRVKVAKLAQVWGVRGVGVRVKVAKLAQMWGVWGVGVRVNGSGLRSPNSRRAILV